MTEPKDITVELIREWLSFHLFVKKPKDYAIGETDLELFTEILALMKEAKAARKEIKSRLDYILGFHSDFYCGEREGYIKVNSAMDAARNGPEKV